MAILIVLCGAAVADSFPAGDANGDGYANVSDAVWIINYIFAGGPEPVEFSAADVNNDCSVNISDAVKIIDYVFQGGEIQKGCKHHEFDVYCFGSGGSRGDSDYVYVEVLGNDLWIHHFNVDYQCCLKFYMQYSIEGNSITATEADSGQQCNCICNYSELKSVYYDLDNGEYYLRVAGIYGDTLLVDTITVNDQYGLINYQHSSCLTKGANKDPQQISYTYSNGVLLMKHLDAFFNCAAELAVTFEQVGDTLRFCEINISSIFVYCMCYYQVNASIAGIPPGEYIAEVYSREPIDAQDQLIDRRAIILAK